MDPPTPTNLPLLNHFLSNLLNSQQSAIKINQKKVVWYEVGVQKLPGKWFKMGKLVWAGIHFFLPPCRFRLHSGNSRFEMGNF